MSLIMEYYLYLNLLKKSQEYTLLGKFWYIEEEEDWYHRKLLSFLLFVFCYVLKVSFNQINVLQP